MPGRLSGKTALVTGAAQGIGRATALEFAREGAKVWATDVNREGLEQFGGHELITALELDVTSSEAVASAAAFTGQTDILVNAAGWAHEGNILTCTEFDWRRSFDVNVTSMYLMIRAYLPGMIQHRSGSIINIGSVVSSVGGFPERCAYGASKGAVVGLTKAIAADYLTYGIRCNVICPGTIDTPSLRDRIAAAAEPEVAMEAFIARQPVKRLGRPEEIAELCVYLAADGSAFMIGRELVIDGGMTL